MISGIEIDALFGFTATSDSSGGNSARDDTFKGVSPSTGHRI